MRHQSGSPQSWKARREAYRKTQRPVSNPDDTGPRSKARRRIRRAVARERTDIAEYRQSIHCACNQCLPGEDRQCPAREPNVPNPEE